MKLPISILILALLTAVLGMIAASVGLFWSDNGQTFMFTTLHGETVEIYGQGLYRNDTLFKAPLLRGTDAVTLFAALPLLLFALRMAHSGSLRGRLLLAGASAYFAYNAASLAFGATYNDLFLLYLVYFSASMFTFVLVCLSAAPDQVAARMSERLPRRLMAAFLVVAGLSVFVWLIPIVEAVVEGAVPHGLGIYTTEVTYFLDLGIIAPTAFLAAVLLMQRRPAGYLLAAILLVLNALIGAVVIAQTIAQNIAGVELSVIEQVFFVGVFVVTSLFAAALVVSLLRNVQEDSVPVASQYPAGVVLKA